MKPNEFMDEKMFTKTWPELAARGKPSTMVTAREACSDKKHGWSKIAMALNKKQWKSAPALRNKYNVHVHYSKPAQSQKASNHIVCLRLILNHVS